jgi:hypothetical protein
MNIDFSQRRNLDLLQRLLYAGAARDPKVADRVLAVGSRHCSPLVLRSPSVLARAAIAQCRPETFPEQRLEAPNLRRARPWHRVLGVFVS